MNFRIQPNYLEVNQFDYTPTELTKDCKPVVDFTFAIGKEPKTFIVNSIKFRWKVSIEKEAKQILKFEAEQQFDFIDPVNLLNEENINCIINESALQLEIEYEKQSVIHEDLLKKLTIKRPHIASLILKQIQF